MTVEHGEAAHDGCAAALDLVLGLDHVAALDDAFALGSQEGPVDVLIAKDELLFICEGGLLLATRLSW